MVVVVVADPGWMWVVVATQYLHRSVLRDVHGPGHLDRFLLLLRLVNDLVKVRAVRAVLHEAILEPGHCAP